MTETPPEPDQPLDDVAADPTDGPTPEGAEIQAEEQVIPTGPALGDSDPEGPTSEVPPPPAAELAAGDPAEASKVDVADEERPAPPVRAQTPDTSGPGDPQTRPLGQGEPVADTEEALRQVDSELEDDAPRQRPAIPGADLIPDLITDDRDRVTSEDVDPYAEDAEAEPVAEEDADDVVEVQPITAAIDLAAGARYRATGKRKSAVARVILKPGTGEYLINGKPLDTFFPRATLQRNIRQPLEAVGYEERMDVVAAMHGGGVAAQAGALRHGIARALLEADPNLRGALKGRGFLTRDPRVKERKKAGLKKARKRPQFSKR